MRFSLLPSLFLVFFSLATALPQGSASKAWAEALPTKVEAASTAGRSGFNLGSFFMGLYRDTVSRVDGDRCPSIPSCSTYSVQAMKKHGFFLGWMMTVDRLIHEGKEETKVSPVVYSEGKWKIFDPVENNDFWWYPPDRNDRD